ncbi:YdeI/OmpD-associated family protein [Paucibacter sp. R3-3]|uniref:YdeI/OmpD-associated family protein n=1 Tax=Roseateles agri TaxID=3098619 RepID=A0ABU5DEE2_9BURK|nr:YdeI/OmpD-associated family protein [Paucibacter sp. R3-3]MDY0744120.1 YdeI/OmpD-associated family protein [Paucibacter sp. R3-3]
MSTPDSRVDAYIAKSAEFARPILEHLRAQIHAACPEAEETIKWSMPCFTVDGRILANMAAFKAHCAFGFWNREAGKDGGGDKGGEAMGQYGRITSLKDLPPKKELQAQIRQAAELAKSGVTRVREAKAPKPPAVAPEDLLTALSANPAAQATFDAFPPGKQRDYIEWITEAKQAATREKRLAQAVEWMAEGKSRNWKYEKC